MFLEQSFQKPNSHGWIEVICGSMFSGKTEELIRRLRRASIAKLNVEIFKPDIDKRYHEKHIVSHDSTSLISRVVKSTAEIAELGKGKDVVGVDEAQFFDSGLPDVCSRLAESGTRVIVAGLDMDFRGEPFGPMPAIMAVAEYVTKVHAICIQCGNLANHSFRKQDDQSLILLGEKDNYAALCRSCFQKAMKNQK